MSEWLTIFRKCSEDVSASIAHDKSDKTAKSIPDQVLEDNFGAFDTFVIPTDIQNSSIDLDLFEERAAIIEYDGGVSRAESERLAYVELMNFVKVVSGHKS